MKNSQKYTIEVIPGYLGNPLHDEIRGCTAAIIDITVGKRGWIAYKGMDVFGEDYWYRLHTSTIEYIDENDSGEIIIKTMNSKYILKPEK